MQPVFHGRLDVYQIRRFLKLPAFLSAPSWQGHVTAPLAASLAEEGAERTHVFPLRVQKTKSRRLDFSARGISRSAVRSFIPNVWVSNVPPTS